MTDKSRVNPLVAEIRSRGLYWGEVVERPGGEQILKAEMAELLRQHGLELLWIIKNWADMKHEEAENESK